MAQARLEVVRLLAGVNLSGTGGDNPRATPTLDLRTSVERIEGVFAQGSSVASQPNYTVGWAGGITTSEVMGNATGEADRFEPFGVEDLLIPNTAGNENWIAAPMPTVIWPFVRFQVTALAGSPGDSQFWLYALIRHQFGS